MAAQLMFEKGGSTVGAFFKAAKRRDTWCPGANSEEETDAAGMKTPCHILRLCKS